MNVSEFCKDYNSDQLIEIKDGIKILTEQVMNRFSTPENISSLIMALQEHTITELDPDILELAVIDLCNRMNIEVIERELFRREMEEKDEI